MARPEKPHIGSEIVERLKIEARFRVELGAKVKKAIAYTGTLSDPQLGDIGDARHRLAERQLVLEQIGQMQASGAAWQGESYKQVLTGLLLEHGAPPAQIATVLSSRLKKLRGLSHGSTDINHSSEAGAARKAKRERRAEMEKSITRLDGEARWFADRIAAMLPEYREIVEQKIAGLRAAADEKRRVLELLER